jgi:hypothetical protein
VAGCACGQSLISVEIAPGELIDKITILEIKSARITDAAKRHHVGMELALLVAARDRMVPGSAELARLASELKEVNEAPCSVRAWRPSAPADQWRRKKNNDPTQG